MAAIDRQLIASEAAAAWWTLLQTAQMSRAEREQLVDWLRESPVHVAAMLRIAQVHGALERFARWANIAVGGDAGAAVIPFANAPLKIAASPDPLAEEIALKRSVKRTMIAAIAAGVCVCAVAITWFASTLGELTIRTERGERREVALADGSFLQVGPETLLRVRFNAHERRVALDYGATLFRVAKNAQRPFIVDVEDTVVRAVGTAFGVVHRDRGVVVTVAEGQVAVSQNQSKHGHPASLLSANQQIAVPSSGKQLPVRKVDSERELAWASGRLVLENQPVASVVAEFNRFNQVQLHVTDAALARRPISGVFDAADPESFVAFVELLAPVRVVRDDDQHITIASAQED